MIDQGAPRTPFVQDEQPSIEIVVASSDSMSYMVIGDNGCGMTETSLMEFADYFKTQEQRKTEISAGRGGSFRKVADQVAISKFGIGAKEAAFYIANELIVITKVDGDPLIRTCPSRPGQLRALSVSNSKSILYGVVRWARSRSNALLMVMGTGSYNVQARI